MNDIFYILYKFIKKALQQNKIGLKYMHEQFENKSLLIYIYMEGEFDEKLIKINEHEISIRTLKKRILNQFQYEQSQGANIQLNIMQIYPSQSEHIGTPILNDMNLSLIIQFLKCYERDIKIQATMLVPKDQMKKKEIISQQALDNKEIHFDENGSIIEQTDPMGINIPQNDKYDNSGHARCQFCQKNSKDIAHLKRCGGLYGPFLEQKYVHLLCALWCHQVFLDDDGFLKNVQSEIQRSKNIKCLACKQKGAGLVCVGQNKKSYKKNVCGKAYHFKCAYDINCAMSWQTFKMLCPRCKDNDENFQKLHQKKEQEQKKKKKGKNIRSKSVQEKAIKIQ